MTNKIILNFSRQFSLTSFTLKISFLKGREGKFMNKLLGNSNKKKKFYIEDHIASSPHKIVEAPKSTKENSRRMAVLNTLFMQSISEVLMTGQIPHDVIGKGLEISRVTVNRHFNQVNVFWACTKEENILELEKLLPDLGFTLRHELSQLRTMGIVPRIIFVKDKNYHKALQVDQLLKIADYGEDYVPVTTPSEFKEGIPAPVKNMENRITEVKEAVPEEGTNQEESFPEMTHDVFGLDHRRIMEKILKRMNKARALHRYHPNIEIESEGMETKVESCVNLPDDTMTMEERKEAINHFLLQKKIQKQNKLKAIDSDSDKSMYRESNQNEIAEEVEVVDDFHTEDYIDDDYYEDDKRHTS